MALTSGFFNSRNGDRTYNAEQMSSLFGGIITDGVFKHYPGTNDHFNISVSGRRITVGIGRAWLNDIWINNDSNYIVEVDPLSAIDVNSGFDRIDTLYFKVDKSNAGREGSIYLSKGTPAAPENAAANVMSDTSEIFYHPIAIFRINHDTNTIHTNPATWQRRIGDPEDPGYTDAVGYTPYIIGPLEAETVAAEIRGDVDEAVAHIFEEYVEDPTSPLYESITKIPMVWLCDVDLPMSSGFTKRVWRSLDHPGTGMAYIYPEVYGKQVSSTIRVPVVGDAMLGANGYYGLVVSASVHTGGGIYDQFDIVVRGTGAHLNIEVPYEDPTFLVSFWESDGCDRTYQEIKNAYDDGKVLRFRWTSVDASSPNFDWESATVYSGSQFSFSGIRANPAYTNFTFKYEDFMPSGDDYQSCGWENVICRISASGAVSCIYEAM